MTLPSLYACSLGDLESSHSWCFHGIMEIISEGYKTKNALLAGLVDDLRQ